MNCQQFRQTIEQAEDEHRQPAMTELRPHLEHCSECRKFWDARRRLYAALQAARPEPRERQGLSEQILQAVQEMLVRRRRLGTTPLGTTPPAKQLPDTGPSDTVLSATQPAPARSRWAVALVAVCLALFCGVILRSGPVSRSRKDVTNRSRAVSITGSQRIESSGPLPQVLEGVEDSYRALTSDAVASLRDVVSLPTVPQFDSIAGGLESPPRELPHANIKDHSATDDKLPLKDVFDFLRQLVPADESATL